MIHALGGDDIVIGTTGDDHIYGGAGNDTLTGNGEADTFHYGFTNAGNDEITDFATGAGGDVMGPAPVGGRIVR
ncbi:hypothetical protein [Ruegeria arenilitoris]|uniref:hypothetical protein n=1 Tax=Ruegeria arenilitoris TaxID=1173585 RepID=UPI00147E5A45